MSTTKQARETRLHLFGWVLFLVCSILFIISSVVTWSPWGLAASIVFFLSCIIFLIPFTWKKE